MKQASEMEQAWRWFGPSDPVKLEHIRQAGAKGIVTSLHHIPYGEIWTSDEILRRKSEIESAGLRWSVVESVQVHNDIKRGVSGARRYMDNYKETLRNLSKAGIYTVCYNFMPVLDWSRTDLEYPWFDGSTALRFDMTHYIAFDVGILKRKHAAESYPEHIVKNAMEWLHRASAEQKDLLIKTILAGLPGTDEGYTLDLFREKLNEYDGITHIDLAAHLVTFLNEITPVAEENGITLTIHPDDPPFSIFGLPRVVSTSKDLDELFSSVPSPSNGLCFCTGSFGARSDNNLLEIVQKYAKRIAFVHLRNTISEQDGSFTESDHLEGDTDMFSIMRELLIEQKNRTQAIPFRPDHGHRMLDDLGKSTNPGYSAIGRLRGLSELRGLQLGILRSGL